MDDSELPDSELVDTWLAGLELGRMNMRLMSDIDWHCRNIRLAHRRGISRHQTLVKATASVVGLAESGTPGIEEAVDHLWECWTEVVTDRDAETEFDAALASAVRKYASPEPAWWRIKEHESTT